MDQTEFSRRLMALAAGIDTALPLRDANSATEIVGRLGFVALTRRLQAALLAVVLVATSTASIGAIGWEDNAAGYSIALGHALACFLMIRHFPYRNPQRSLKEGLIALSKYQLNDSASFIARQRTDLSAVSNRLLNDLCTQLTLDKRRGSGR